MAALYPTPFKSFIEICILCAYTFKPLIVAIDGYCIFAPIGYIAATAIALPEQQG